MRLSRQSASLFKRLGPFALAVIKQFRANQGFLLAGAVAYYTLLSLVPLLILVLLALSHVVDEERLLVTLRTLLEFVVPGQADALVGELRNFFTHRGGGRQRSTPDHAFFQRTSVYGSGECDVGDFLPPRKDQAAAFPRICGDALRVHRVPGFGLAHYDSSLRHFPVYWCSKHNVLWPAALPRPARRAIDLPYGGNWRDSAAFFHLSGDAGWALVAASCADRRCDCRSAMGNHPAHSRLVLYVHVADSGGLRVAYDLDRGPAQC